MLIKLDELRMLLGQWHPNVFNLANRRTALVAGIICCLFYAGLFALPKRVSFSYATPTCTGELALLPGMHRAVDDGKFKLEHRGGLSVGKLKLASTKICFVPNAAPRQGVVRMASAPFGGWMFRGRYDVAVGDAPRVLGAVRPAQALSQPVELALSQRDTVFRYSLYADGKAQPCIVKSARLMCGVDRLGLKQGTEYALKLQRWFGDTKAGEASVVQITILPAIKVIGASVRPDELVYTKPRSLDVALDKPPVTAAAKLELLDGDKVAPVNARVKVDGVRVLLAWDEDLPREKTFRLTLTGAVAADGSLLDGAYSLNFRTSGGPTVLGVNIGGAGVAGDARVVVTFDQTLSKDIDIARLAGVSGGGAIISRQGKQVVFALRGIPPCGAFTLNIAPGLVSEDSVASGQGWSHASRINCRSTRTIGYSVRGRPIQAYFYGSGPTTVLFTGGIHGDEASGTYIMQDWASHLDVNGYKIPAGKQVVIVPNLNPDGIALGRRYNVNNVNIDRNFPSSDWISDISLVNGQVLPRGGGVVPLSEPETKAIADLTSSLQLRAAISYHASGAVVGANKVADSVAIGSRYAAGAGYGTVFYDPEATFGYTLTGEYETWIGEKLGAPAILIELPTKGGRYFSRHLNMLWSMVSL